MPAWALLPPQVRYGRSDGGQRDQQQGGGYGSGAGGGRGGYGGGAGGGGGYGGGMDMASMGGMAAMPMAGMGGMGMMMGNSLVSLVPVQLPNGQVRPGGSWQRSLHRLCTAEQRVVKASCGILVPTWQPGRQHGAPALPCRFVWEAACHPCCRPVSTRPLALAHPFRLQIGYMMGGMPAAGAAGAAGGEAGGAGGPMRGGGYGGAYGGGGYGGGAGRGGGRGSGRGGGGGQRYQPY